MGPLGGRLRELPSQERQGDVAARGSRPAAPAQITLAPIVLIKGPEGLLVDRALDQLRALAYEIGRASCRERVSSPV